MKVVAEPWPFADRNAAAIDAYWSARLAENPNFFNGVVHMLHGASIASDVLSGSLARTDFKSYLYWRETGHRDDSVRDAFGSALLRSAEGHVILGKQRPGNINSGQVYLPGGFIDTRDVAADGMVDIEASILRELKEETGVAAAELQRVPGVLATCAGPIISIAAEFRSLLPAEELQKRIRDHIAAEADPELEDAVIVRSRSELPDLALVLYARQLLESPEIFRI